MSGGISNGEQERPSDVKPKDGLIGYFDILGYTKFLENNPAEKAAWCVNTLLNIERETTDFNVRLWAKLSEPAATEQDFLTIAKEIQWAVFSDTILLTLEMPMQSKAAQFTLLTFFICQCSLLFERMFTAGLPLRGIIDRGQYIGDKTCFAGTPIIDAYKLTNRLHFAGCVITEKATRLAEEAIIHTGIDSHTLFAPYSVPTNEGEHLDANVLNVHCVRKLIGETLFKDISDYVREAFEAHGKSVDGAVPGKIENTEKYFRFLEALQKNKKGIWIEKS